MLLQPFFGLLVSEEKAVSDAYARGSFDILLSASVVFVSHMHNRSSFTTIGLLTEYTNEVFLDFSGYPTDCTLLPRTVFSITSAFAFHET